MCLRRGICVVEIGTEEQKTKWDSGSVFFRAERERKCSGTTWLEIWRSDADDQSIGTQEAQAD